MTTTWGGTGEGPGSGGEEVLPIEVEVFVSPSPALAVGEVQISVSTSRPVTSIDLYDGDVPLVLAAAPTAPLHVLEVTSEAAPGDGPHTIRAVAHAADGGVGEGEAPLMIDVQPGGSDAWTPFVQAGPISGFTSAALRKHGIDTAGFFETNQGIEAVAVRIDGTTGLPQGGPIVLGPVAASGGGRGPAVAVGGDATFVAWTQPSGPTTRWAVSRVVFGEPKGPVWSGPAKTSVHALAVVGDTLVLAGSLTTGAGTHDLRVWWVAADTGEIVASRSFAMAAVEDPQNLRDEVARGVAIVGDEVVVVGEREIKSLAQAFVQRTVVLRHTLDGEPLAEWTSPGEQLDEDGAMAVAPLGAGGFVTVGWARDKGSIRQVMTRWFSAEGEMVAMRIEPTPANDAVGFAVGEDREGKIVIAGAVQQPKTDANAWIFAVPGAVGAPTWQVIRNGPGQGPDEAAGLAVDPWGHTYVVGSEFAALQPRAFALRLYP
ncbi:hypothetical protein [Nannocystis bainbridge]|uniref:Uncharacterized protein n=1 Tax=Nannocystis bainbridge TaxID=2995303 RepID=A0ABT5DZ81_9BACT|nr:hypothetical protein [Nannocystis bainbridge]MDC0717752.1 hypothetical protein [Nannocystis bainbridge]